MQEIKRNLSLWNLWANYLSSSWSCNCKNVIWSACFNIFLFHSTLKNWFTLVDNFLTDILLCIHPSLFAQMVCLLNHALYKTSSLWLLYFNEYPQFPVLNPWPLNLWGSSNLLCHPNTAKQSEFDVYLCRSPWFPQNRCIWLLWSCIGCQSLSFQSRGPFAYCGQIHARWSGTKTCQLHKLWQDSRGK